MSKHSVIIGAGTMGSVIAAALHTQQLTILRRESSRAAVDWPAIDVVWLAVKPQDFPTAIADLPALSDKLVISVMAGITTKKISHDLKTQRVIRCMPNTPIKIGQGMTVWYATPTTPTNDIKWFGDIFGQYSKLLAVNEEEWIDKATAISGSGPAYLFTFIEALTEAAANLGFSPEQAKLLVMETCRGAITLLEKSNLSVSELRHQVTSKGGTTAAALNALELAGFNDMWNQAIQAAYAKVKTLSA